MNLELYKKGLKVINDCKNTKQLESATVYVYNIRKVDRNVALGLKYPLHVKIEELNNKKNK